MLESGQCLQCFRQLGAIAARNQFQYADGWIGRTDGRHGRSHGRRKSGRDHGISAHPSHTTASGTTTLAAHRRDAASEVRACTGSPARREKAGAARANSNGAAAGCSVAGSAGEDSSRTARRRSAACGEHDRAECRHRPVSGGGNRRRGILPLAGNPIGCAGSGPVSGR